jgi:AcrR family transcriptional regulator
VTRAATRRRLPRIRNRTPTRDHATRERLLGAARALFAERGFQRVAVREICHAAGANVAAINYHFGDKLGLYLEVVRQAVEVMRETNEAAMQAPEAASAEDRIRSYLRVYVRNVVGKGRDSWIHRLMNHELHDPTPALDIVVDQAIAPRMRYLSRVVAELLGCDVGDDRVLRSVASIQGQALIYLRNPIAARLVTGVRPEALDIEAVAQHIADFSIAGLRAMARGRHHSA